MMRAFSTNTSNSLNGSAADVPSTSSPRPVIPSSLASATTTATIPKENFSFTVRSCNYLYGTDVEDDAESIVSEDEHDYSESEYDEDEDHSKKVKSVMSRTTGVSEGNYYYSTRGHANSIGVPSELYNQASALKLLMPALFKSKDCTYVLNQFFSNELFFANNLCNLKENFLNYDFASFDANCVLFPVGTIDPALTSTVLEQLEQFSQKTDRLVEIINKFNHGVVKVVANVNSNSNSKVSLETLKIAKDGINAVIDEHLSGPDGLDGVINDIIDMLYDYNLLIQNNQSGLTPDLAFTKKTTAYYSTIESTLKVTSRIYNKDVTLFKTLMDTNFTNNKQFHTLVENLMEIIQE